MAAVTLRFCSYWRSVFRAAVSFLAAAVLLAGQRVSASNSSSFLCNHAEKLLRESHPPGHTRVRDFDFSKLAAVFDAYQKCAATYRGDPFVLFFAARGMGYVAELRGTRAYAYAVAFIGPGEAKLRSMPKAAAFYALQRRYSIEMLTDALNFYREAQKVYDSSDARFWSIDGQESRANETLNEARALPAALPIDKRVKPLPRPSTTPSPTPSTIPSPTPSTIPSPESSIVPVPAASAMPTISSDPTVSAI